MQRVCACVGACVCICICICLSLSLSLSIYFSSLTYVLNSGTLLELLIGIFDGCIFSASGFDCDDEEEEKSAGGDDAKRRGRKEEEEEEGEMDGERYTWRRE